MSAAIDNAARDERAEFIEKMGILVENEGWMPRMIGRALGCLLVADAPLTQAELRTRLEASAGAISSATRVLLDKRLAEKVSLPGSRKTGFQVHPNAWRILEEDGLRGVRDYSTLAGEIIAHIPDPTSPSYVNLRKMERYFEVVQMRMTEVLTWLDDEQNH